MVDVERVFELVDRLDREARDLIALSRRRSEMIAEYRRTGVKADAFEFYRNTTALHAKGAIVRGLQAALEQLGVTPICCLPKHPAEAEA